MEQRTEEWFNARLGKVTASRIADLMANRHRLDDMGRTARGLGRIHDGTLLTRAIERVASLAVSVEQTF